MAIIRPFNALMPEPSVVTKVASVPYDVLNTDEAKNLTNNNQLSLLNCTRSEIHFPTDYNPYEPAVYLKAKDELNKIIKEAPLNVDSHSSLYLYELTMDGRKQTGIAAAFSVDDYDNNIILKHEKTRKEKEDDRTNHIVVTGAQTGPVFLTYKGVDLINNKIEKIKTSTLPIYDFIAEDGITHKIWRVPQNENEYFINEIGKVENLYIADGHHRAASASRARKAKKDINSSHSGNEEYNYFLAVLFPAEELKILSYNRVVKDLNGKSKEDFLGEVSEKFLISETNEKEPTSKNNFGMYFDGKWYKLVPNDSVKASNSLSQTVSDTLDVSILQNFLLNPVLGIDDPRTNKRVDFVGGIRGTSELEKLVDSNKFAVAFSMFPVSVYDLIKISDAGEIMPPKSTWFEPKLRDGLLIHLI